MVKLFSRSERVDEQISWDRKKLVELGVNEDLLKEYGLSMHELQGLVKDLLYLRERYPEFWQEKKESRLEKYRMQQ